MTERSFETLDVYLASAISILLKTNPEFKVSFGKTLFVFPINDELYKAMSSYNSGVELNAYEYSQCIRRLRAEMLSRKGVHQ